MGGTESQRDATNSELDKAVPDDVSGCLYGAQTGFLGQEGASPSLVHL